MDELNTLLLGYKRFRAGAYAEQRSRFAALREGQSPQTMVIACSDSRVDPAQIFDVGPGEIFVVRNVANLVPPFETDGGRHGVSAALEFAVTQLEVRQILVLGHGGCGGVKASLNRSFEGAPMGAGGFIAHWIDLLDEARDKILDHHHGRTDRASEYALELESVKVSLQNLRSFPCIRQREAEGRLQLTGAYFAIADGILHILDEETQSFHPQS